MSNYEKLFGADRPVHHRTKKIELTDTNQADLSYLLRHAADSVRYSLDVRPTIVRHKEILPVEEPVRLGVQLEQNRTANLELRSGAIEVDRTKGQKQDTCSLRFKPNDANSPQIKIEQSGNLWTVLNVDANDTPITTLSAIEVIDLISQVAQQSQDYIPTESWRDREHPADKPHIAREIIGQTAQLASVASQQETAYRLQTPFISSSPDESPVFFGQTDSLLSIYEDAEKASVHMITSEPMLAIGTNGDYAGRLFSATDTIWRQSKVHTVRAYVSLRGTCQEPQIATMLEHEKGSDAIDRLMEQALKFVRGTQAA